MSIWKEIKEAFWPTVIALLFVLTLYLVCTSDTMSKFSHDNCPIHTTQETCQCLDSLK